MSRTSSTVTQITCDVIDCQEKQVHVVVAGPFGTEAEWGEITLNGQRDFDLCPDHLKQFEDFMYGPDDFKSDYIDSTTGVPFGES